MSSKKNREEIDNLSSSPFASIVLKEKKEEAKWKKTTSQKKPGEIVHGYNPSLSFGDILSSFEKTGNPYSLPKKNPSVSKSFGDILDEWENGTKKKTKTKEIKRESGLSSYKATRSFASILNEYEGIYREKEEEKKKRPKGADKAECDDMLRSSSLFLSDDDEDVPQNVSWSVKGGSNPAFKREEKEKKTEEKAYKRTSGKYTPTSSFSDILSSYENSKRKKKEEEKTVISEMEVEAEKKETIKETSFFIEDDETEIPSNVSWSVLGGRNENFVREIPQCVGPEEKKDGIKETKKSEYKPSVSFGDILSSYDRKKAQTIEKVKIREEKEEQITEAVTASSSSPFFIESDEGEVPSNVSWSIMGGANKNYTRPVEEERKEKQTEEKEEKKENKPSPKYTPTTSFSSILSSYEKKTDVREKTFIEIMEEKGDGKKKKSSLSINELRRMDAQATLDLHGETQNESEKMIATFISECVEHGLRKISIITGKGLHSENGNGVLKDLALSLLGSSEAVQEVSPAPLSKGGSGALWVILKEKRGDN